MLTRFVYYICPILGAPELIAAAGSIGDDQARISTDVEDIILSLRWIGIDRQTPCFLTIIGM